MSPLPRGSESNPALLLPPDIARELQVASLVCAGTAAVFIWDILQHLPQNYYLLYKHKFRIPTLAYLVSTIASLTYVLGFTLFSTYPLGNCRLALIIFDSLYPILSGATSLLFFFRVRAIYGGDRLVTWIFGLLWICVVGSAILVPFGSHASNIGSLCIIEGYAAYSGIPGTILTVNDTAVFFAISYRLLSHRSTENTAGERNQAVFSALRGANLQTFSRALFRDGQTCYMISVSSNILTISMAYSTSVNPIYRTMFSIPNVALTSIMACRVYRNAKLYHRRTTPVSIPLSGSGMGRFVVPLTDQVSSPTQTKRSFSSPQDGPHTILPNLHEEALHLTRAHIPRQQEIPQKRSPGEGFQITRVRSSSLPRALTAGG